MNETKMNTRQSHRKISYAAYRLVELIYEFDSKYPLALEPEFLDFLKVVEFGRLKHPTMDKGSRANWLEPNGSKTSHKDMHDSMFHHLSRSFANINREDHESKLDHLLHLICRGVMMYIRIKRGIKNKED